MKYCNNCGKEVDDNAVICPSCGCAVASKNVEVDKPKACGKWALIGFCVAVGLSIISAIVSGALISSAVGGWYSTVDTSLAFN